MSDTFIISTKELQEALKKKNVTVIDVIKLDKWDETGYSDFEAGFTF